MMGMMGEMGEMGEMDRSPLDNELGTVQLYGLTEEEIKIVEGTN
jgi:hypothetical protein